jgi:uncharacterized protein YceK
MKKITLFLLAAAVLSGCSTPSSLSPAMQADLAKPIICKGSSECKTMWKRAFQFVSLNAGYKIYKANAVLINTHVAREQSARLSMSVEKSPLGSGIYQLKVKAWCNRTINIDQDCSPRVDETLWRAQLFIREGKE